MAVGRSDGRHGTLEASVCQCRRCRCASLCMVVPSHLYIYGQGHPMRQNVLALCCRTACRDECLCLHTPGAMLEIEICAGQDKRDGQDRNSLFLNRSA